MNISENIRDLRKSAQMTQNELAEMLGISEQAVSKWENGVTHPDISVLPQIAKLFRVSMFAIIHSASASPYGGIVLHN